MISMRLPLPLRDIIQRRSPKWGALRRRWIAAHPICACCGNGKHLNVHHIEPFSERPDLELDEGNLLTLCEKGGLFGCNCHLVFGHLGHWAASNPHIRLTAQSMASLIPRRQRPGRGGVYAAVALALLFAGAGCTGPLYQHNEWYTSPAMTNNRYNEPKVADDFSPTGIAGVQVRDVGNGNSASVGVPQKVAVKGRLKLEPTK